MDTLNQIQAERKRLQEERESLATQTLSKLNADKSGTLEVTIVNARNVDYSEDNIRFLIQILPHTAVSEDGEDQIEIKALGGMARFPVKSLEADVVVQFGREMEHLVKISLHKKYKDKEVQQLSDWYSSSVGIQTETPEIRDMTGTPQVQVHFQYHRSNKAELQQAMEEYNELEAQISELYHLEKRLDHQQQGGGKATKNRGDFEEVEEEEDEDDDDDEDDEEDDDEKKSFRSGKGKGRSLWKRVGHPILVLSTLVRGMGSFMWRRRAIFMFVGSSLFFHHYGEDMAV